jgi:hypothetical protein
MNVPELTQFRVVVEAGEGAAWRNERLLAPEALA